MAVAWVPGRDTDAQPAQQDTGDGGSTPGGVADTGTTIREPVVGEPNELSGTSPANGANGRHSAG
jgi:hypothetical protein